MVKVRDEQPLHYDGSVNLDMWLDNLQQRTDIVDLDMVRKACSMSAKAEEDAIAADDIWAVGTSSYRTGLEMADILVELGLDEESLVAALIYRAVREGKLSLESIQQELGQTIADLVQGVLKMAAISGIQFMAERPVLGQAQDQLEQARKMLISLVDDVRVALIKLAERTCAVRAITHADAEKRQKLAHEVFDIYAPLAHRLGIGHLKWELEDLSFRYIEPEAYKRIAALLDERRVDRERNIEEIIGLLKAKMAEMGIEGTLYGRAKHIYSIWGKMKEKGLPFSQIYDVRAVRILVPEVTDCYRALGVVHSLWHNIPHEFDDYIATPKENGYRSLHTAVVGLEGKILEVQIRTHDMHEDAELGVCSHWQYKTGNGSVEQSSDSYEQRINWLRQIIMWQEDLGDSLGLAKDLLDEIHHDRIYVFTPDGHVIDMIPGATPLDFAYRVHTEVGHSCRGAKVNGQLVSLNSSLQTGDRIEVVTANESTPRREWLVHHLGYLKTSRARAKVQSWFRQRDREKNISEGKSVLAREFHHLGIEQVNYGEIAETIEMTSADDLFAAVGAGELDTSRVIQAAQKLVGTNELGAQLDLSLSELVEETADNSRSVVAGVGNMNTKIAECCNPVPGDPIVGLIDENALVYIHQEDCIGVLLNDAPANLIAVFWELEKTHTFPVDIVIRAYDRAGLLFDITAVLGNERINMKSVNTLMHQLQNTVDLMLTVDIASFDSLLKLLEKIEQIPNVVEAKRRVSRSE
jgi:GTP pyrophosphokinase|tara:strand:- start:12011 stop:14260 length:2250 start_codon:yes stop_codon:yes gene_type:complete